MKWSDFLKKKPKEVVLCGVQLEGMPANSEELNRMMAKVAVSLIKKLPTEQDVYWFVIEQYDRIISCGQTTAGVVSTYPVSLFEIEYYDRKSENSYVGHKNPGIVYVLNTVLPDLVKHYGVAQAQVMLAFIFGTYLHGNSGLIQALRLKYAVHYHNNCISTGSMRYADEWGEVIDSLDE